MTADPVSAYIDKHPEYHAGLVLLRKLLMNEDLAPSIKRVTRYVHEAVANALAGNMVSVSPKVAMALPDELATALATDAELAGPPNCHPPGNANMRSTLLRRGRRLPVCEDWIKPCR